MSSFEEQITNTDQNDKEESKPIPTLEIPLSFWINNNNNFKEFDISKIKVSNQVKSIMDSIDFDSKDLKYYSNIRDSILEYRYELQRELRSHILIWPSPCYFQQELDLIDNHIRGIIVPEKFYSPLILDNTNEINGYTLYECDNIIMDWFSFIELTKLYKSSKTYSKEEFFEKCSKICCTDWCKMDRHGECFGGFWLTDKENAWKLSQQDNFQGLYELPFPHDLIFRTIDIGCGNRSESVRYSNFLCWWIESKMKQLDMI
jgi:hypothetical protein